MRLVDRLLRPRLTYANVTATLALFLALGGGAYAATALPARSVGSRELKKDAVTRVKIKRNAVDGSKLLDGSITGTDIKESTLGPVPAAANATHAAAAAVLDRIVYKSAGGTVGPTSPGATVLTTAAATAVCDAGQHAIGGGVRVDNAVEAFVIDEFPDSAGTAWTVRVGNSGAAPSGFTAVAICTTVGAVG
jgi:hypothetical protein